MFFNRSLISLKVFPFWHWSTLNTLFIYLCICSFSPLHSSSPGGLDIVWPWPFRFYVEGSTSASTLSLGGKVDKIKSTIFFFPLMTFFYSIDFFFLLKKLNNIKKYQKFSWVFLVLSFLDFPIIIILEEIIKNTNFWKHTP